MRNNSLIKSILRYLAIALIWLFPLLVVTVRRSWIDANQIAFHLPLLVGIWVILRGKLTVTHFAVAIVCTVVVADFGLIDDYLYIFMLEGSLFPSYVSHNGFVNPQYTKILLYMIVIFFLALRALFARSRTPDQVFVLLSTVACLVVTLAIHNEIPGQNLSWSRSLSKQNMESAVSLAKENPSVGRELCEHFRFRCFFDVTLSALLGQIDDVQSRRRISREVLASESRVSEVGVFEHESWKRLILGAIRRGDDRYDVFFESNVINRSQKLSEESFGRLATIANLTWGWLLILLGMFHNSPLRKKLFQVQ